jgi:hypothetical protein
MSKALKVSLTKESYKERALRKVAQLKELTKLEVYNQEFKFIGNKEECDKLRNDNKVIDKLFKNIIHERGVINNKATTWGDRVIGSKTGNIKLEY